MFDGLLKSKFYTKCKSGIKLTKTRIEMIRRKRNAMQKYLKNDIVDLLKSGLDVNAYGRAEGLLAELKLSSCYDFIEQFCVDISSHLVTMDKQRGCPEECQKAVASLMFAAARFADLPELREIRNVFHERYGDHLDSYVHKEFAEKLKLSPPSKDAKLQLLEDVASEYGLAWNWKALEDKLCNVLAPEQGRGRDNHVEVHNRKNRVYASNPKEENKNAEYEYKSVKDERKEDPAVGRENVANPDDNRLRIREENFQPQRDRRGLDHLLKKKLDDGPRIGRNEEEDKSEALNDEKPSKYRLIPPPYTKSEGDAITSSLNGPSDSNEESIKPVEKTGNANRENNNQQDESKPKPKSVRRRHLRPPPGSENSEGSEANDRTKEDSKSVHQENVEQSQRILKFLNGGARDHRDEEERTMDKLLRHYSRKKGNNETGKSDSAREPASQHVENDTRRASKPGIKDSGPTRIKSFPTELTSPTKTPKQHTRTSSLQPEMLGSNGHVHPKLPDYDDFVARLAVLRRS